MNEIGSKDDSLLPPSIIDEIDLACDRFESALKANEEPDIAEFIKESREPQLSSLVRELLLLDVDYCTRRGKVPQVDRYQERLPDHHALIETVFRELNESQGRKDGIDQLEPEAKHGDCKSLHSTKPFSEILVEGGFIKAEDRQAIEHLLERHVAKHGDDPQKSLSDFSPTVSFAQSPDISTVTPKQNQQDDKPSSKVFGDYELLEEIAKGGMGVVYKARQSKLNRIVALKMIRSGKFADDEQVKRFQSEAEAAAKLDHPGIVPVFEVGEANGQHFFSMAFVEGESLYAKVKDAGPMPPKQAATLIRSIAKAVEFAHDKGIVHRDIKPQNILLEENGEPRVTDFGLAKHVHGGSDLTATGQVMGTPSYMPPEQASGEVEKVGTVSDVYSLGATLYYLLTARPPFQAASPVETIRQMIDTEPVPPRRLNPDVSRDLETVCLKCLQKEAPKRYSSAAKLADDLDRWLENKPIVARPVTRVEKAWLWCKRRPAVAGMLVTMVLLTIVGTFVATRGLNATHGEELVKSLIKADTAQVSAIITEMKSYRTWANPKLYEAFKDLDENSKERLHVGLAVAMLADDDSALKFLEGRLLTVSPNQFEYVRDLMADHKSNLTDAYWKLAKNVDEDAACRFQATCALATYDPQNDYWRNEEFCQFIADHLVGVRPSELPPWRNSLRDVQVHLIDPLAAIYRDDSLGEKTRLFATDCLADYTKDDPQKLISLLLDADADAFEILFPVLQPHQHVSSTVEDLRKIAATLPPEELGSAQRVRYGQRRANAAVTLLRLGEREKILPVFDITDDPEALTQFIFRCRPRGVGVEALLGCLQLVIDAPTDRYPINTRYALLLGLGEFSLREIPETHRDALLAQVADWYRHDPSSGVHGASGWLLRQWGQMEIAREVDQTAVPYSADREWFTLAISVEPTPPLKPKVEPAEEETESATKSNEKPSQGDDASDEGSSQTKDESQAATPENESAKTTLAPPQTFYYTFVVFGPGEYTIGSVEDEPDRRSIPAGNEQRHGVHLTRTFAMLDREITFEELIAFKPLYARYVQLYKRKRADAGFGVDWYDSVNFCRWLGQQSGLSESSQAYASPGSLDKDAYPREPHPEANWAPLNWPVDLGHVGFRLPTESEWEVASRSGVRTVYGYGSDVDLLGRFGWFIENSGKYIHAPRGLRPSVRGLFDLHGNLDEWTHDWHRVFGAEALKDPKGEEGEEAGSGRVNRGGSAGQPAAECRAANRHSSPPTSRAAGGGFRLALSPSEASPEAVK